MSRRRLVMWGGYLALLAAGALWGGRPAEPLPPSVVPVRPAMNAAAPAAPPFVEHVVERAASPEPKPAAREPVPAPVSVTSTARVADAVAPLVERAGLTGSQQGAVEEAAARKQAALAALQERVYAEGLGWEEVSRLAEAIQSEFEAALRSTLRTDQVETYERLKREGVIGTYAIVVPTGGGRR